MTTPDELSELAGFRNVQWTKETPISEQIRISLGDDKATIKLNLENPRLGIDYIILHTILRLRPFQLSLASILRHTLDSKHISLTAKSHIWRLDI